MGKSQWIAIFVFVLGTCILYFSFDVKPKSFDNVEKDRKMSFVLTDINGLIRDARNELSDIERVGIDLLNKEMDGSQDSLDTQYLEKVASEWFKLGYPEISGYYAKEIAGIKTSAESWGIAGTTFAIALKRSNDEAVRDYSFKEAVDAFDRAISLDMDNVDHKLNKALVYTDKPLENNPMKGVQDILSLNKQYPEHIGVLNQLGRLAIRTNQYEKAVQRLEKVLSLQPENKNATCMLAVAYEHLNEISKSNAFKTKCTALNENI